MPDWRYAIERRLDGLRLAPTREAELVEELSQHLDDRYNELRIGGATEEDAYRDALEELGACGPREGESASPAARASGGGAPRAVSNDADLVRELTGIERPSVEPLALGSASTRGFIGGLWQDLCFGARLLVKNRGASLVVIITLALAIAANAIVFGFADLLLLRPLPIDNADRVVTIYGVDRRLGHNREWLSISDYLELRRQATSLADVSAMTTRQASLVGAGEPRAVTVNFVTTNVLSTWGLATLIMGMFVGFAAIGLTVAVAGVYGVTAFSVNQRRHEIGVRMAVGATAANVVTLFISRSLRLILIGVAVGVAAGWAMGRTMNGILVETSPSDPATYTTVIGLIVMSGLVASLVPASRAVSIDPIAVLKRE